MTDPCRWCGETHLKGICPKVKAIEFYEMGDGTAIKRVEFMTPSDYHPFPMTPYPSGEVQPLPRWGGINGADLVPVLHIHAPICMPTGLLGMKSEGDMIALSHNGRFS